MTPGLKHRGNLVSRSSNRIVCNDKSTDNTEINFLVIALLLATEFTFYMYCAVILDLLQRYES